METIIEYLSEAMENGSLCYFKDLHHGNRVMNVVNLNETIHLRSGHVIYRSDLPTLDENARKEFYILRPVPDVLNPPHAARNGLVGMIVGTWQSIREWIIYDWEASPSRLMAEVFAASINLTASMYLAAHTYDANLAVVYAAWLSASVLFCGCALSRRSVGFFVLYGCFVIIETMGFLNSLGVFR